MFCDLVELLFRDLEYETVISGVGQPEYKKDL